MRSDGGNGVLDYLHPVVAIALGVLGVVEGDNLILEQRVDGGCVKLILIALVLIGTLLRQSPACALTVAFNPPTIKHGEIDDTVHLSFLARGTRCLQRTGRCVHPDVDTRHQTTGQLHIVILEEDNLAQELRHAADFENTLNQALTSTVGGMGLT